MCFTTDIDMLQRVKKRDSEAWDHFYLHYTPLIRLHGRDCGLPPDMLDDLGQEVVLAILRGNLRPGHRFRPYLRAIIRNRATTMLRCIYRNRAQAQPPFLPEDEAADADIDRKQQREWQTFLLTEAVERLRRDISPLHFQIFDLMYHHGWKAGKVARFLGIPAATVYSIDRRNLVKLRAARTFIDD